MSFRRSLLLLLFFLGVSSIYGAPNADDPEKDAAMDQLLQDARQLIDAKKLPAAVQKCDQIITRYRKHYSERKEKVYCARTSAENLGYLVMSAAEMNKGTATKEGAITLSATWSNAYFLKAYALQEMGRMAEAKAALKEAVQLAPWNPQYLCELGSIYQLEKDWPRAREVFELAEDQAALSPQVKRRRSWRGRVVELPTFWLNSVSSMPLRKNTNSV